MLISYLKQFVLALCLVMMGFKVNANPEYEAGKALFNSANCAGCHSKLSEYNPIKEVTNNFKEVRGWVKSCVQYFDVAWFPQEETEVALYLNHIYYHYPLPDDLTE